MARVDGNTLERCAEEAEAGDARAQFNLGLFYSTGHGVELDLVTAHKWFNLAAAQGAAEARAHRCALADQMTDQDIAEAQRQAREWLAARRGPAP